MVEESSLYCKHRIYKRAFSVVGTTVDSEASYIATVKHAMKTPCVYVVNYMTIQVYIVALKLSVVNIQRATHCIRNDFCYMHVSLSHFTSLIDYAT